LLACYQLDIVIRPACNQDSLTLDFGSRLTMLTLFQTMLAVYTKNDEKGTAVDVGLPRSRSLS